MSKASQRLLRDTGDSRNGCCENMDRRTFLQWTGLGAAAVSAASLERAVVAGPFDSPLASDHFVPADKKLSPDWVKALFAKGDRTWYSGHDLETIAMPIGGICAGQLYLAGDGRLVHWDIFNKLNFTGYGRDNYQEGRKPASPLFQGFAIQAKNADWKIHRTLDSHGFPSLRFSGEYPIATVEYRDDTFPVSVQMEAFSPFIPLNEEDSALPATLLEFTVTNTSDHSLEVDLVGWLENGVCLHSGAGLYGTRVNRVVAREELTMFTGSARRAEPPAETRPPRVLADFEGDDYGGWTTEGEAFGEKPANGTLDHQQQVSGFQGQGLVNTYLGGSDALHGKLVSPAFNIDRNFLCFLIGGGDHAQKTCINLLVDGKAVRTAMGKRNERLQWHTWDVREFAGKKAVIQIVDAESGPWGHINIDQITLRDQPAPAVEGALEDQSDYGSMGLAVLGQPAGVYALPAVPADRSLEAVFAEQRATATEVQRPFDQKLIGAVGCHFEIGPAQSAKKTFIVCWYFPNRHERGQFRGNFYATRFDSAKAVARYIAEHYDRLAGDTRRWHATWYDSSLPHWLLDRLMSTASTLATSTCQWWANGRFWAWEGVGCCYGTCAHVWNYEHTMARLFPRLERSVREMQDFNPEAGLDEDTGAVHFRGEGWKAWAGDSQGGTVLKALREHQISADNAFLKRNWPRIKKCLEFLIREDGDNNGLLEGSQHNTYDINFFGPNTMVGSLYLAALLAGEQMAKETGNEEFAAKCRKLFETGRQLTLERLFNGEYFIQEVDLKSHPKYQYADGCLADQLFGQGWAHQVGLGYVYPQQAVLAALESIWRYNWAPDVGPQNAAHAPERWFARPGEAGLFTCTWPKSPHLPDGVRYKNEVWTGIEYQVAGNMAWDGMVMESLAIVRAIHERYHPSKHNPWNEIECGDHYARGMASHGVFLGLCGFQYHGPAGRFGFAPRIGPDEFRAAFTGAEGWGTISQHRRNGRQVNGIEVGWGSLRLRTLVLELPEEAGDVSVQVIAKSTPLSVRVNRSGQQAEIELTKEIRLAEGETIEITCQW